MYNFQTHEQTVRAASQLPELKSMTRREFIDWLRDNEEIYLAFRHFVGRAHHVTEGRHAQEKRPWRGCRRRVWERDKPDVGHGPHNLLYRVERPAYGQVPR